MRALLRTPLAYAALLAAAVVVTGVEVPVWIHRTTNLVGGFTIPGLRTRRATTTVELRDGQAFAIAGLIQDDFEDTVRQLPGLGDVPILGALMRSSAFQRNETELVIIVEPH